MKSSIPASVASVMQDYTQRNDSRVVIGRCLVFAIIFVWIWLNYGRETAMLEAITMLLFALNGIWGYIWRRWRRADWWVPYLVVSLDCVLLTVTLFEPGRIYPPSWPWPMALRQPSDAYYLILLGLSLLSFRVWHIVWSGFCIVVSWITVHLLVLRDPAASYSGETPADLRQLSVVLDPQFVLLDNLAVRCFGLLMLTGLLAVAAYRLRQLLSELAEKTRERGNLARYLAPDLVEQLAQTDNPLGPPREVEASVLFADIMGFTAISEALGPAATMALLRRFHRDMADAVFEHGGTLDKFIGDGLMATFGIIDGSANAKTAERAVACALDMQSRLARWNDDRRREDLPPIRIGIGLHKGPVTIGDIGHANRLEFAVVGDTVNLASRIEGLTRELNADIIISETIASEIANKDGWRALGTHRPHGRQGEIQLWGPPL